MHYVCVLQDPKRKKIYVGFSSDLRDRMRRHRNSEHPGWRLVYYEAYLDACDARKRERQLKHHAAAMYHLKGRMKHSFSRDFESVG